jgi:conjugal transfer ATP-binding protein TraC
MYSNPVGEGLFIDPSKAERNPHALVVGQSGSGKSFFVHDYLLHLWRLPDVRLYLISIKPDYRKLALLLGRYVELTLDCTESLNPFGGAPTLENQARWVAALGLMLTEGRPGQRLSREQEIALQESALTASARNWDAELGRASRETILEDICLELERRAGAVGRELAFQLFPYRRGPFRRLFNRVRTLGADDRFVFFNLGNILRQPCSAAVSFCVFSLIDEVMHDPSLRAIPKGLIADEVWALVQDPLAAAILERSLKAYRSLGGFALPIVQDPRDLDTPAGRVILVNTATKIILPMDRSGQDDLSRFVRLNDRELELVQTLRLVKRRYSEFFVSIEGIHSAKGLIIPDPLRYAISTTDPADEAQLDRLYQETGSMLAAVQQFARDMPYGVAAVGS